MKPRETRNQGSRHASVVEFSREHHHGLVFCSRMKRHIAQNRPIRFIQMLFRSYWLNELQDHTERESEWAQTQSESPELLRMQADHHELEALFRRVDALGANELQRLADQLQHHIRFEERVLFPLAR